MFDDAVNSAELGRRLMSRFRDYAPIGGLELLTHRR